MTTPKRPAAPKSTEEMQLSMVLWLLIAVVFLPFVLVLFIIRGMAEGLHRWLMIVDKILSGEPPRIKP